MQVDVYNFYFNQLNDNDDEKENIITLQENIEKKIFARKPMKVFAVFSFKRKAKIIVQKEKLCF